MAANECIPTTVPGDARTVTCGAAVIGKRFVKITAPRTGGGLGGLSTDLLNLPVVQNCNTLGEAAIGVAGNDQAINLTLKMYKVGNGVTLPVTCSANITAGQEVQTDATGQAIPLAAGKVLGYAMDSAASGADVEIALY